MPLTFWTLTIAVLIVLGVALLLCNEWLMRRNDRKAEKRFPHDDDARATYAFLRDLEGFGNVHWISERWAARRRREPPKG